VAVVTRYPRDPQAPRGGVESVSVSLVEALARQDGLEVHVVTTEDGVVSPEVQDVGGLRIHRLPRTAGHVLREAVGPGRRQMASYLATLGPDVIHSHDVYGLMVKGLDVPRVFTVHGFIHADTLVSGTRLARPRSWVWRRVEVAGWADQPHIISISPYVRERLRGLTGATIHDIENPVAPHFFDVPRAEAPGTILSAALIEPRKNTLVLVEALGRLVARGVDARLRLAGPVSEPAYGRRLEERVRALSLQDRVERLGSVPSAAIRAELSRASVFALASLEENAPMGVAEAMAAGVPVVTSNRCGMPYMVQDGETGFLVDPLDVEDVADRLQAVLTDPDRRASMQARSREVARDRYHPDRIAARTREVYERAVRRGARAHAAAN
jgi:glycosyltransferase involved in cell wall biosynthesis